MHHMNPRSLANLRPPLKKGDPALPGAGRPPGPSLMTRLKHELDADGKFGDKSINEFKKRITTGDPHFWRMMIDLLEPAAKERIAAMMGVNVNVSANAQAVAALPAPDVSSADRMAELAALFSQIPALAAPIVQVPNGSHQDIRAEVAVRPTGAESPQCEKNAL